MLILLIFACKVAPITTIYIENIESLCKDKVNLEKILICTLASIIRRKIEDKILLQMIYNCSITNNTESKAPSYCKDMVEKSLDLFFKEENPLKTFFQKNETTETFDALIYASMVAYKTRLGKKKKASIVIQKAVYIICSHFNIDVELSKQVINAFKKKIAKDLCVEGIGISQVRPGQNPNDVYTENNQNTTKITGKSPSTPLIHKQCKPIANTHFAYADVFKALKTIKSNKEHLVCEIALGSSKRADNVSSSEEEEDGLGSSKMPDKEPDLLIVVDDTNFKIEYLMKIAAHVKQGGGITEAKLSELSKELVVDFRSALKTKAREFMKTEKYKYMDTYEIIKVGFVELSIFQSDDISSLFAEAIESELEILLIWGKVKDLTYQFTEMHRLAYLYALGIIHLPPHTIDLSQQKGLRYLLLIIMIIFSN